MKFFLFIVSLITLVFLVGRINHTFAQTSGFVTTNGAKFMLNGKTFRPVGVNMYDAASNPNTHNFLCGPSYSDTDIDASFSFFQQHGYSAVRFWAFQSYVKNALSPDWSGIDRLITEAKKYNLKLLPVLENTWTACSSGPQRTDASWYISGYKSPYGSYALSYVDWVKLIVGRYKNEPTIMAWTLMNEAEDNESISSSWTPSGGVSTGMYNFARDMSALIKSIDSNHLVTLGTLTGNVGGGIHGAAYAYIHKLPTIDFIDAHDYSASQVMEGSVNGDGKTLPPNCSASIACILWLSLNDVHKPMLIGEAGINLNNTTQQARADMFNAKIPAFFNDDGAGFLIWHWDPHSSQSYDFSPNDPLAAVLAKYASTISPTASPSPSPKPTPSADGNNDGKIDGADYVIWLIHFGQNISNGPTGGDFNRDGKVDISDFNIWNSSY